MIHVENLMNIYVYVLYSLYTLINIMFIKERLCSLSYKNH